MAYETIRPAPRRRPVPGRSTADPSQSSVTAADFTWSGAALSPKEPIAVGPRSNVAPTPAAAIGATVTALGPRHNQVGAGGTGVLSRVSAHSLPSRWALFRR